MTIVSLTLTDYVQKPRRIETAEPELQRLTLVHKEQALSITALGPKGDRGPPGEPGAPGEQGPPGPPGDPENMTVNGGFF